ncbi:radical SAM protein [Streptococcus mitis]|uniref:radical SAM protein n=1 Tax=Streptococcus mitis TaxID=28037 RepID=UPI0039C1ADD7
MNSEFYDNDIYALASKNKTLLSVTIELTTRCNWRCKHCYLPSYVTKGISRECLYELFQDLREMGTFELLFTGGEIFTRPDTLEIIRDAREMFFDVKLFTNVSLLNEEIIKALAELNISQVSCTVFSMNENIHDQITSVKGSLKKTVANLNLLKEYDIPVEVKQIILTTNQNCIDEVSEFCKNMNFKHLATTNIFYKTDGNATPSIFRVSDQFLNENIVKIDKIRNFRCFENNSSMYVCNATRYSCTIESNGNFLACNNLNMPIGNILNTSIKDIWLNSTTLHEIQNKKFSELEKCTSCPLNKYCNRCSGIALLEDKSLWGCLKSERQVARARYVNQDYYSGIGITSFYC